MGFDPFLVELEAGGHREEVAVLRGTNLAPAGGLDLAPICWLLVFYFSGFLVDCGCKVEFNQPSNWLYSVPNLLVFQHLVTLYLGGFVVRVVSEIECRLLKSM